jgi:hypothetical protein
LAQPILKVPGEVGRSRAFGLGGHVAIAVIQITGAARARQPIEWLIAVSRAIDPGSSELYVVKIIG